VGIAKAWITNLSNDRSTATAIGFYTSFESICALLASFLAGAIWSGFGAPATFGLTACAALVTILYLKAVNIGHAI